MIGTSIEIGPFKLSLDLAENTAHIYWVDREHAKCSILNLKFLGGQFDVNRTDGFGLTLAFTINGVGESFEIFSDNNLLKYTTEVSIRAMNQMLDYIQPMLEEQQRRLLLNQPK